MTLVAWHATGLHPRDLVVTLLPFCVIVVVAVVLDRRG